MREEKKSKRENRREVVRLRREEIKMAAHMPASSRFCVFVALCNKNKQLYIFIIYKLLDTGIHNNV